jgi:hypothetical protein
MRPLFSTRWLQRLQRRRPLQATLSLPDTIVPPDDPSAGPTIGNEPQSDATADDAHSACGWYESSHELHRGLAVAEWPAGDDAVAALWFGCPAAAPVSGALH